MPYLGPNGRKDSTSRLTNPPILGGSLTGKELRENSSFGGPQAFSLVEPGIAGGCPAEADGGISARFVNQFFRRGKASLA